MSEKLFNVGYVASAIEATPGIALTPTDYFQAYDWSVSTQRNFEKLAPAAGNVYGTQTVTPGPRDHNGDATFVFEPNTAEKLFAMMLAAGNKAGSDPYNADYTLSSSVPKTYTFDVSDGRMIQRYYGCQVEKMVPERQGNEWRIKPTLSAIGTFNSREIASIAGTSPYVITLKTDYDPAPATGVVVGDIMQLYEVGSGSTINFTVSAVTGTTISTTTNVAAGSAGDMVYIRPSSISFNMLPPCLWSNTVVGFGSTASGALSNATIANQTRVDDGSAWEISYPFKDAKGEHRSGSEDPMVLLRKPAEATLTIKKYWDTPLDVETYNNMAKTACVIRHFVYYNNKTYEVRITFNNLTTNDPIPKYKAGEINYSEIKYIAKQDFSDGQAFDVKLYNSNATLT